MSVEKFFQTIALVAFMWGAIASIVLYCAYRLGGWNFVWPPLILIWGVVAVEFFVHIDETLAAGPPIWAVYLGLVLGFGVITWLAIHLWNQEPGEKSPN